MFIHHGDAFETTEVREKICRGSARSKFSPGYRDGLDQLVVDALTAAWLERRVSWLRSVSLKGLVQSSNTLVKPIYIGREGMFKHITTKNHSCSLPIQGYGSGPRVFCEIKTVEAVLECEPTAWIEVYMSGWRLSRGAGTAVPSSTAPAPPDAAPLEARLTNAVRGSDPSDPNDETDVKPTAPVEVQTLSVWRVHAQGALERFKNHTGGKEWVGGFIRLDENCRHLVDVFLSFGWWLGLQQFRFAYKGQYMSIHPLFFVYSVFVFCSGHFHSECLSDFIRYDMKDCLNSPPV